MKLCQLSLTFLAMAAVAACSDQSGVTDPSASRAASPALSVAGHPGFVATLSNAQGGNELLVFRRQADGSLGGPRAFDTGGNGTGAGLGSQGALVGRGDHRALYAVNAGSNDISVFTLVGEGGPRLLQTIGSGGTMPISLTVSGRLLYVLNAGGDGNVSGFAIGGDGSLTPLAGSTVPLSAPGVGPAEVAFTPGGHFLTVTEKGTGRIDLFPVEVNGLPGAPVVNASSGLTPFGFSFGGPDALIVSEAAGGMPGASTASSYIVGSDGSLVPATASLATGQTAICWIATTHSRRYAYGTNTGSGNVTGFRVSHDGELSLLSPDGVSGVTGVGTAPIDAAVSRGDRFLYVLNSGTASISGFRIRQDGLLKQSGGADGLPVGGAGLVAF